VDITLATPAASTIVEIFIEKPSLLLVLFNVPETLPGKTLLVQGPEFRDRNR
jgi:hypothetical protein